MTGVPVAALEGAPLLGFTVQERLRWAVKRETKRKEDKAYCLLGILGVVIPVIYGEGEYAFTRLREAIALRQRPHALIDIDDHSSSRGEGGIGEEERRQELLASLRFDEIDSRHGSIKPAERTTCSWILEHATYRVWIDREIRPHHLGILWISGRAGAGKSTLMKFALSHATKNKREDEIILSFFFNARGEEMERTTFGMYRSILWQLLNEVPDLQLLLNGSDVSRASPRLPSSWTLESLQGLLSKAVKRLGQRRLCLFIDALDECDEEQVREMIKFFEELETDVDADGQVDICFASRPYPLIDIECGQRLELEQQAGHADDLKKFINRRLQIGKGKLVHEVQQRLQDKANGVFMWVVLVVDALNQEFRRGRIFAVRQRLQEIPSGLSDLFRDLLRRDTVNMDDLLLCLQWILFSKRPLRREEFYFAMVAGWHVQHERNSVWVDEPWNRDEATIEVMDKFVLSSSKGLAEVTRAGKNATVQFIHESVNDFLLKDGGLYDLWPELAGNFVCSSHEKLKNCCLPYLDVGLSNYVTTHRDLPKASSSDGKKLRARIFCDFPFHQYAIEGVLHHANEAASGKSQEAFVGQFPIPQWVFAHDIHQIYDTRRYRINEKLLYILAKEKCFRLISMVRFGWPDAIAGRHRSPLVAAFENGNRPTLKTLLGDKALPFLQDIVDDPGFGRRVQLRFNEDPPEWAERTGNVSFLACLSIPQRASDLRRFSVSDEIIDRVFHAASLHGYDKIVRFLLDDEAYAPSQSLSNTSLCVASNAGHGKIVQLLLNCGTYVSTSREKYDALVAASAEGHAEVAEMILRAEAIAGERRELFESLLQVAAGKGDVAVTRLLLNSRDYAATQAEKNLALITASDQGDSQLAHTLINAGADVNARNSSGAAPLHAALQRGHMGTVNVLLQAGVDVGEQDLPFLNLTTAVAGGRASLVEGLLHGGADLNACDTCFGNALQAASAYGNEEIVDLLLGAGAHVNAHAGDFGSALQAASWFGYTRVVEILLDAGADVDAQGGYFGSPLLAAVDNRHAMVVEMLLNAGADANAHSEEFGSALQAASRTGETEMVEMLLQAGADVNAQGGSYGSALQEAQARHSEDIVQILLGAGATTCDCLKEVPDREAMESRHQTSDRGDRRV